MAEEAAVSATAVGGSSGGNGDSGVLAGYGQGTETPGAMESRGDVEALGQLEVAIGLEERTTEGHSGGGSDRAAEETEASPMREPRADLGKAPIIEEELVEEPVVERDMPPMFVGSGVGAGSSRHIGMGDYLEAASMEDLLETVRGIPGLAEALLASREAKLQAELGTGGAKEPQVEEKRVNEEAGEEMAPRRSVVDEATTALQRRGAYDEVTYMPF
ncbi:hypothetical protein RHMOL_Rhmol10G0169300 [Rhododendron molle]|uniref:Uncharacterized protein n=1 Tax=Rhododendron molle TaxID=49168 RepID=A0ACC0M338_RHOML|nr:hypothetical protein RHMOL_Rhmol10G0169300 [Rhododendron molle]